MRVHGMAIFVLAALSVALLSGCVGGSRGTGVRSLAREEAPADRILRGVERLGEDPRDEELEEDEACVSGGRCRNNGRRWR